LEVLREALEDPDRILGRLRKPEAQRLMAKLVELNLVVEIWGRDPWFWIDVPPLKRIRSSVLRGTLLGRPRCTERP